MKKLVLILFISCLSVASHAQQYFDVNMAQKEIAAPRQRLLLKKQLMLPQKPVVERFIFLRESI